MKKTQTMVIISNKGMPNKTLICDLKNRKNPKTTNRIIIFLTITSDIYVII